MYDGKLHYIDVIHLHQSYVKLQIISLQSSDPQYHLESQSFALFSSSEITFFSMLSILLCYLCFSTCKSISKSFEISISLSKLSKPDINLLLRLMIKSDVSWVLFSFETNELCMAL